MKHNQKIKLDCTVIYLNFFNFDQSYFKNQQFLK